MTTLTARSGARPTSARRDSVIEVEGLRKSYAGAVAVDGVTFDVAPGEIYGILGTNGAGKTTTVECIQGLRRADAGTIRVLGHDPRDRRRLANLVGSQLQDSALPDRIKVGEAVKLFGDRRAVDTAELLDTWGLTEHRRVAFGDLSGGLRQRVFIALALLNQPVVVFFDELTQGLDPLARRGVWDAVETVRQRGTTVVLVTHFMDEAEALCDRLAIFEKGRILAAGTPQEIIRRHATTATISFSAPPTTLDAIERVAGVERIETRGNHAIVVGEPSMIAHVCAALVWAGPPPEDLRIIQPNLEDAVLAIEGAAR